METGKNTQIHRALRRENSAVVKCWCSSVFGFTAQLGFFGEAVAVVFNLVVESLERLLHGGNAFLELVALLDATERPVWKTFPYCTHDHALALERALDLLGSNLDEDLALEDAARCANMGLSTFKQRFLHAYGLSPMAYRRQCRVEEGARLLAGSRESVASVAARVGYRNPSKFAAAFVERFGATPSAWRARG